VRPLTSSMSHNLRHQPFATCSLRVLMATIYRPRTRSGVLCALSPWFNAAALDPLHSIFHNPSVPLALLLWRSLVHHGGYYAVMRRGETYLFNKAFLMFRRRRLLCSCGRLSSTRRSALLELTRLSLTLPTTRNFTCRQRLLKNHFAASLPLIVAA